MTLCRFAPSPTGFLHVGNIRAAIINFLYAKKTGGKFMLRLDDTDAERVRDEYRDSILKDMSWLGLEYSLLAKQSDRLSSYENAKNILLKSGRLYECYESEMELSLQRKSQIASGTAPIYNRAALNLTLEQKANLQNQGLKPYYRFLLKDQTTSWDDKIKGRITYQGRHFSDPVLVRESNIPTYTFCSVVDDLEFGVTDIIRGEDHITNTAVQIQIFEALIEAGFDGKIPCFSHLALVKALDGKISKREGGFDVKSLRNEGFEAFAVINLLSQIGTSEAMKIYKNFDELIKNFSFSKFSKSAMNYDLSELLTINQKLLQELTFEDIKPRLTEINLGQVEESFFYAIRPNISLLHEIKDWLKICQNPFRFNHLEKDVDFLKIAAKLLPQDTKNKECWDVWLSEIKKNTDRKGKDLFMPIRLALSGKEHGPELKMLVNFIERNEILARLL